MNPLSAFSFGQLIKTFLPGLIASASPLLLLETLYAWKDTTSPTSWLDVLRQSFANRVIAANPTGSITLLVLVALLLGFSLNSIHWSLFHNLCRSRCVSPELDYAKRELKRIAKRALDEVMPGLPRKLVAENLKPENLDREIIPAFFLPQIDLAKHTFLRESYFAWYEFHMNSLAALGLVLLTFIASSAILAWHWQIAWRREVSLAVIVTVVGALVMFFLWRAALRNLRIYEERFFWLVIGTLHSAKEKEAQEGESKEAAPEIWRKLPWAGLIASILFSQILPPRQRS